MSFKTVKVWYSHLQGNIVLLMLPTRQKIVELKYKRLICEEFNQVNLIDIK